MIVCSHCTQFILLKDSLTPYSSKFAFANAGQYSWHRLIDKPLLEHTYYATQGYCGKHNLGGNLSMVNTISCHRLQTTAMFYLTVRDTLLQPLMFFNSHCQRTIRNIFQGSPKDFFCYSCNISLFQSDFNAVENLVLCTVCFYFCVSTTSKLLGKHSFDYLQV